MGDYAAAALSLSLLTVLVAREVARLTGNTRWCHWLGYAAVPLGIVFVTVVAFRVAALLSA